MSRSVTVTKKPADQSFIGPGDGKSATKSHDHARFKDRRMAYQPTSSSTLQPTKDISDQSLERVGKHIQRFLDYYVRRHGGRNPSLDEVVQNARTEFLDDKDMSPSEEAAYMEGINGLILDWLVQTRRVNDTIDEILEEYQRTHEGKIPTFGQVYGLLLDKLHHSDSDTDFEESGSSDGSLDVPIVYSPEAGKRR